MVHPTIKTKRQKKEETREKTEDWAEPASWHQGPPRISFFFLIGVVDVRILKKTLCASWLLALTGWGATSDKKFYDG